MQDHEAIDKPLSTKDVDDKLNEVFEITPTIEKLPVVKVIPQKTKEDDTDTDFQYSRENLYNIIERGSDAMDGLLEIAKETEHPRAYEVVGQLIGQVGDTVDKLQDLQKKLKDLKELPGRTSATIKNALFVGSTAELQKMLNKKRENETVKSETKEPKKD